MDLKSILRNSNKTVPKISSFYTNLKDIGKHISSNILTTQYETDMTAEEFLKHENYRQIWYSQT